MDCSYDFFASLPKEVEIREVGPREGFQSEKMILSTSDKVRVINALMHTGIRYIQVGSLVHPKLVPQMADTEDLFAKIDRIQGVKLSVLVPNVKGAERARKVHADDWNFMLSVSDAHSKTNANATTFEAMDRMKDMLDIAKSEGVHVNGGMGTAFGCPFSGQIPLSRLYDVIERYLEMGITSIGVADTAGMAAPKQIFCTMRDLKTRYPDVHFKLHLHNTRGLGIANVLAGMQAGVTSFDTAVGGLGGCPFVPGASGNVSTEDLVHMLDLMGIKTGVEIKGVIGVTKTLEKLYDHPCYSYVAKAGLSSDLQDLVAARKASTKDK